MALSSINNVWMLLQLSIALLAFCGIGASSLAHHPAYPAIFTFGDSLSDAGNVKVGTVSSIGAPYGVTLGRYTGRSSDGLLTIDIITKALGLGELAIPSLAFDSTEFSSLDFAYAGAHALSPDVFPHFHFPTQISHFLAYKQSVIARNPVMEAQFEKALYVIEFGINDMLARLNSNISFESIRTTEVPKILEGLRAGIMELYQNGSRNFFIVNIPGIGCSPSVLAKAPGLSRRLDRFGCLQDVNEAVSSLNEGLKALVVQRLREELPRGRFILFDFYEAKHSILENSHRLGFKYTTQSTCCGSGGVYNCSRAGQLNLCGCGDIATSACSHPSEYVSWDGLHYTQHFYAEIAAQILEGKYVNA